MDPLTAVAAVVGVFVLLATLIARVDGLTFLAPKSASGVRASAEYFCVERCRENGVCPLAGTTEPAERCPLRMFVASGVPTQVSGRPPQKPFEVVGA